MITFLILIPVISFIVFNIQKLLYFSLKLTHILWNIFPSSNIFYYILFPYITHSPALVVVSPLYLINVKLSGSLLQWEGVESKTLTFKYLILLILPTIKNFADLVAPINVIMGAIKSFSNHKNIYSIIPYIFLIAKIIQMLYNYNPLFIKIKIKFFFIYFLILYDDLLLINFYHVHDIFKVNIIFTLINLDLFTQTPTHHSFAIINKTTKINIPLGLFIKPYHPLPNISIVREIFNKYVFFPTLLNLLGLVRFIVVSRTTKRIKCCLRRKPVLFIGTTVGRIKIRKISKIRNLQEAEGVRVIIKKIKQFINIKNIKGLKVISSIIVAFNYFRLLNFLFIFTLRYYRFALFFLTFFNFFNLPVYFFDCTYFKYTLSLADKDNTNLFNFNTLELKEKYKYMTSKFEDKGLEPNTPFLDWFISKLNNTDGSQESTDKLIEKNLTSIQRIERNAKLSSYGFSRIRPFLLHRRDNSATKFPDTIPYKAPSEFDV